MEKTELKDLKEIAIGKIKAAYNHSIDFEATHSVLWDLVENKRNSLLKVNLILAIILLISIYIPILYGSILIIFISNLISGFIVFSIIGITFLGVFQAVHAKNHKDILHDTVLLRRQSIDFLQYKLDNLDKKGYINELKSLEVNDKNLKEKSLKYTEKMSTKIITTITYKVDELEKAGFKKHVITQDAVDSANAKLQKFSALRNCEAWIKFD